MKSFGVLLLMVGGIWAFIAFNMNTTVITEEQFIGSIHIPRTSVNNLGLMDERRNHLMMSGLIIIVGVILFVFGSRGQTENGQSMQTQMMSAPIGKTKKCPYCAEIIKLEAITCRFCQKDLPPVAIDKEESIKEINSFMEHLSVDEKAQMEKYLTMTEAERRKKCFVCNGTNAGCLLCASTESKLKLFTEGRNILKG